MKIQPRKSNSPYFSLVIPVIRIGHVNTKNGKLLSIGC
ncbi:hypothetical protein NTGHW29_630018 [Candidatus Nitrotoga sp. HW29]|nr:hypothetical protein NTGHW29_630018 [Candidatus Nitrotoga sp. HW29]